MQKEVIDGATDNVDGLFLLELKMAESYFAKSPYQRWFQAVLNNLNPGYKKGNARRYRTGY